MNAPMKYDIEPMARNVVAAVLDVLEHRWPLSELGLASVTGHDPLAVRLRALRGRLHGCRPDEWTPWPATEDDYQSHGLKPGQRVEVRITPVED